MVTGSGSELVEHRLGARAEKPNGLASLLKTVTISSILQLDGMQTP